MSRPQIGIDRLPMRRPSNEPREAMNCKSCRKRKIKCNRLRPSCEACQVFNCECVYDAIPKKRGPKTDVLEALLKRVNGLEKRLKDEGKSDTSEETIEEIVAESVKDMNKKPQKNDTQSPAIDTPPQPRRNSKPSPLQSHPSTSHLEQTLRPQPLAVGNQVLVDTYFDRLHSKPYYILDEAATRQRCQTGQLPPTVINAIHAVTARYAPQHLGGQNAAARLGEECAVRARSLVDIDDPTIENVQVLLLLSNAFFQIGKGKKSYMLLSNAISMAYALNLHRELPAELRISPNEREGRRKLFWTCYVMDRFIASGSRRPSFIADEAIFLRLPGSQDDSNSTYCEGPFFSNGTNIPLTSGPGKNNQRGGSMLIEIVRILGVTNKYLAAGGVKGDSHFPWHTQSNLSKIRQDLDNWAANAQDAFVSIEMLFGQTESSILVLSKLIYHLVHCLIYRPFLPIDLAELSGAGQHQSWQIEATNLCFLHANAIIELIEIGKTSSTTEWPAFVGYCLCTAGTIHVHGAHYASQGGDVLFARSSESLSREMSQLSELRCVWAGVQHQRETLQTVYGCHSQLVKSLARNPMRFSPVFQMEDFFHRYPGQFIDGANVTFVDIAVETIHETLPAYNESNATAWQWDSQIQTSGHIPAPPLASPALENFSVDPSHRKRRRTNEAERRPSTFLANSDTCFNTLIPPYLDFAATPPQGLLPAQTPTDSRTFTQHSLSPPFNFNPWQSHLKISPGTMETYQMQDGFDNLFSLTQQQSLEQQTPGGLSANGSANTDGDKDPFMSLLEQLAENERNHGGPSDLDYFLSGQG